MDARTLVVTSWGGSYARSQAAAYFAPFAAATGHRVLDDRWGGNLSRIRERVERRTYDTDLLDVEGQQLEEGCVEGLLEPIDPSVVGVDPRAHLDGAVHRCGVGSVAWSLVVLHDPGAHPGRAPAGWADFWDMEAFPGGRGLDKGAAGNLEIALMSDGVPPEQVYRILETEAGVARAFERLEALRPHVHWWEAGAQPARLLADRDVTLSTAWNGQAARAIERAPGRLAIAWTGQILHYQYWAIPRGHRRPDLAYAFIAFATRPDRQAAQAALIPYGPLRRDALDLIGPARLRLLPTAPAHLPGSLRSDIGFWYRNRERLERRFADWLAR